ncbi:MaoC family dehydratase [Steroidobacter sp.]|uniref:MaoC family dehydratase n=1 Tax=Steroidobacter sp. TaxID=1978227 RepID=UPI001A5EF8F3|nr:MaoC family dehydratase [Steroidobacter sp.]MBL8270338.1 MaoC family dehydratase [Steroidobacter sp.]
MMAVGDSLPSLRIESISAEKMRQLADVLRDPNPIHLDPAAVARLGLGNRVINQGPANLAYIVNMLRAAFPKSSLTQLDARFLANVFAGDAVEAGGRVTSVTQVPEGTRIACETWLNVDGRGPAVTANASLLLGDRT